MFMLTNLNTKKHKIKLQDLLTLKFYIKKFKPINSVYNKKISIKINVICHLIISFKNSKNKKNFFIKYFKIKGVINIKLF